MERPKAKVFFCLFAVISGNMGVGNAEGLVRGETVTSRDRPELDPLGLRAGGFLIYPDLSVAEEYNDNIFAVENGEVDDYITLISPGVTAESDWNNHALSFEADAAIGRYADNTDESFEDYSIEADGRLDITRRSALEGALGHTRLHVPRGSPNDVEGETPTVFYTSSADSTYIHRFNRMSLQLSGSLARFDFNDVPSATGTINNDDRDYKEVAGTVQLGYELSPEYEAFVRGDLITRSYDEETDNNGIDRSSDGGEFVAGTAIDLSGITSGEVFIGYTTWNFDDPRFGPVGSPTFGAEITWNPTGLTTVTGSVTRTLEETILPEAPAYFDTRVGVVVDHELRRYLLLKANVFGAQEDFQEIGRQDYLLGVTLGASYLLNRNFYLSLEYRYAQRDAEGGDEDFNQNAVAVGLQVNL